MKHLKPSQCQTIILQCQLLNTAILYPLEVGPIVTLAGGNIPGILPATHRLCRSTLILPEINNLHSWPSVFQERSCHDQATKLIDCGFIIEVRDPQHKFNGSKYKRAFNQRIPSQSLKVN